MKLRHRLISWLAAGDAIIMNLSFFPNGAARQKELGDHIWVHNSEFHQPNAEYGILVHERADSGPRRAPLALISPRSAIITYCDFDISSTEDLSWLPLSERYARFCRRLDRALDKHGARPT